MSAGEEAPDGRQVVAEQPDRNKENQRALDDVNQIQRNPQTRLSRKGAVSQGAKDDGKNQNTDRTAPGEQTDVKPIPSDPGIGGKAVRIVIVHAQDFTGPGNAGHGAADQEDQEDFPAHVHPHRVGKLPLLPNAVHLEAQLAAPDHEEQNGPDGQGDEQGDSHPIFGIQPGKPDIHGNVGRMGVGISRPQIAIDEEGKGSGGNVVQHDGGHHLVNPQLRLQNTGNGSIEHTSRHRDSVQQ